MKNAPLLTHSGGSATYNPSAGTHTAGLLSEPAYHGVPSPRQPS